MTSETRPSRHKAAVTSTCQTARLCMTLAARHSEVRSVSAPIAAPAAAFTSAAITVLRTAGRRLARSRFSPMAAAAITACTIVDAVVPEATTGTITTEGTSHQPWTVRVG
jgi:hypothetical protein